jgi:ATP-dependent Zn protease
LCCCPPREAPPPPFFPRPRPDAHTPLDTKQKNKKNLLPHHTKNKTTNRAREYNPNANIPDKPKAKAKKKRKGPNAAAAFAARFSRNPAAALTADLEDEDEEEGEGRSTDIKVVAKDTGVRFADIAGMQGLVAEMRVLVKCLLGDPQYKRVGAKAPRVRVPFSSFFLPLLFSLGAAARFLLPPVTTPPCSCDQKNTPPQKKQPQPPPPNRTTQQKKKPTHITTQGIIFQGPPGTGKTYLARAIAGEAGVPFLSAVGSEFIEMYSGVAAARVSALYRAAHSKAPCIVFIDEIDAIGRSRSALGGDPGSQEREQALLTMLVQMDGIHDRPGDVLTIGATNLVAELDQALLRPGRFEVVYEIPAPDPRARAEILRYHARAKQVDPALLRGPGAGAAGDDLEGSGLMVVAEATGGWSAASLANLLNEAAIVTVRRDEPCVTLPLLMELVELQEWGPPTRRIPQTPAKRRLAHLTAAKAVAYALTPAIEAIDYVTLWSRKRGVGPLVAFVESERNNLDAAWGPERVELLEWAQRGFKTNAAAFPAGPERLGELAHVASLLVPLYAPRIFEMAEYGSDGASLATAAALGDCFDLAYYCARNSQAHPRYRRMPPLHTYMRLGIDGEGQEQRDLLALRLDEELG